MNDACFVSLRPFELCEVGFFKDHVDAVVLPNFDVVVIADNLALKSEIAVWTHLLQNWLKANALTSAVPDDVVFQNRVVVNRHELAEDHVVHANRLGKRQVLLDRVQTIHGLVQQSAGEPNSRTVSVGMTDHITKLFVRQSGRKDHYLRVAIKVPVSPADVEMIDASLRNPVDDAISFSQIQQAGPIGSE